MLNLILAKITILCPFFTSNRLLICQKLGHKPNVAFITFFALLKSNGNKFFILPRIASFYFKADILSLSKAQENSCPNESGIDADFASNSILTILSLLN